MLFPTGNLASLQLAQNQQKQRFSHILPYTQSEHSHLAHQEKKPGMITKVKSFPPCPFPLLILTKTPNLGGAVGQCLNSAYVEFFEVQQLSSKLLPMEQPAPRQISHTTERQARRLKEIKNFTALSISLAGSSCTLQKKLCFFSSHSIRFPRNSMGSEYTYLPWHNELAPP